MGKNDDKQYQHIMDALNLIHAENLFICKLIYQIFLKPEQFEKVSKEVENSWNKMFDDIRKNW